MSATSMMDTLWGAALPHLTDEDLVSLDCTDSISNQLVNLSEVMRGIGCLVANEGQIKMRAGSFQSHNDVPTLLFSLAENVEHLGRAAFIASEANFILQKRKDLAAKVEQAKGHKPRRTA